MYIFILLCFFVLILQKSVTRFPFDIFTMSMYRTADELQNRYPNKKIAIYYCETAGNTPYSAIAHSTIFLLDKKGILGDSGVKLGIKGKACEFPLAKTSQDIIALYPRVGETVFYDISKASEKQLIEAGWQKDTFKRIYESTARWWFREQP